MRFTKTILALAIAGLMLVPVTGLFAMVSAAPEPVLLEELVLETGTTDRFGGGDYVLLKIRDARFGVFYGTEENPNGIRISSEVTRHLFGADIARPNGELIRSGAMPVRTTLAQEFRFMVEFDDWDSDWMLSEDSPDVAGLRGAEPVKAVSLERAWEISEINEGRDANGSRTWDFSLTATNLMYDRVWLNRTSWREGNETDGFVEEISFIFHITASELSFDVGVPWVEMTMTRQRGRMGQRLMGSEEYDGMQMTRLRNRTFNGTTVTADVKYDHLIEGWDFEDNENLLALETTTIFGDHWHSKAPALVREMYQHRIGERNRARMEIGEPGEISTDFGDTMTPRLLHRNRIEFGDDWQRIGRLTWVSDVEITNGGQTTVEEMKFQVHGGGKVSWQGFDGNNFEGFAVRAAFVYPAGEVIFHDPGLSTDALFLDITEKTEAITPSGIFLQASIAVLAIAGVVGYRLYSRKPEKPEPAIINKD